MSDQPARRLNGKEIGELLVACLHNQIEDYVQGKGGKVELPFRFLLECSPLANLVSQGKVHLTVDNRLLSDWNDFILLTQGAADELLVTIFLV